MAFKLSPADSVRMKIHRMYRLKSYHIIISVLFAHALAACSVPEDASVSVDSAKAYDAFEAASINPASIITHEDDWTIISRTENGDRVYWFVAPDINNVSPAVFKKTVHVARNNEQETVIVSECEAPKQTCDGLMERFKMLSKKYK